MPGSSVGSWGSMKLGGDGGSKGIRCVSRSAQVDPVVILQRDVLFLSVGGLLHIDDKEAILDMLLLAGGEYVSFNTSSSISLI